MIDQDNPQQQAMALGRTTAVALWPHLKMIFGALRASRERFALYWLGFALVVIISATAYGQIHLNAWNKPFYDALSRKEFSAVIEQLLVFARFGGGRWRGALCAVDLRKNCPDRNARADRNEDVGDDALHPSSGQNCASNIECARKREVRHSRK